jgi:hypothetical protein
MNVLLHAKYSVSLLCDNTVSGIVEFTYKKFTPGIGYRTKTGYVYTTPAGNWNELKFAAEDNVNVSNFLNTMVIKNLDVRRKLASLELYRILDQPGEFRINLLNAMRILDPTFVPPHINKTCGWQCELMEDIVSKSSFRIIATCRNEQRLERYFTALQALQVR